MVMFNEFRIHFLLLIIVWIYMSVYYFSYIINSLSLVCIILFMVIFFAKIVLFLKYLLIMIYLRGIVVFVLYISCSLVDFNWNKVNIFVLLSIFFMLSFDIYNLGLFESYVVNINLESFYIFIFVAYTFYIVVISTSIYLYKSSGSLRI